MPTVPPDVYGPFGALVLLCIVAYILLKVIKELWLEHLRADADDRSQRDIAVAGWQAQTEATKELADAIRKAADRRSARES